MVVEVLVEVVTDEEDIEAAASTPGVETTLYFEYTKKNDTINNMQLLERINYINILSTS